jgi:hypothetical protein
MAVLSAAFESAELLDLPPLTDVPYFSWKSGFLDSLTSSDLLIEAVLFLISVCFCIFKFMNNYFEFQQ